MITTTHLQPLLLPVGACVDGEAVPGEMGQHHLKQQSSCWIYVMILRRYRNGHLRNSSREMGAEV